MSESELKELLDDIANQPPLSVPTRLPQPLVLPEVDSDTPAKGRKRRSDEELTKAGAPYKVQVTLDPEYRQRVSALAEAAGDTVGNLTRELFLNAFHNAEADIEKMIAEKEARRAAEERRLEIERKATEMINTLNAFPDDFKPLALQNLQAEDEVKAIVAEALSIELPTEAPTKSTSSRSKAK